MPEMIRYAKPEAGTLTGISTTIIPAADGFAGFSVSALGVAGLAVGIPLSIAISPFFVFMVLPTILVALMFTSYFNNTVRVSVAYGAREPYIERANKLWAEIRGQDYVEDLALPIVKKIYSHASNGGHGIYGDRCSGSCDERLKVLSDLVPAIKRPSDNADIEEARNWIADRKSLNA